MSRRPAAKTPAERAEISAMWRRCRNPAQKSLFSRVRDHVKAARNCSALSANRHAEEVVKLWVARGQPPISDFEFRAMVEAALPAAEARDSAATMGDVSSVGSAEAFPSAADHMRPGGYSAPVTDCVGASGPPVPLVAGVPEITLQTWKSLREAAASRVATHEQIDEWVERHIEDQAHEIDPAGVPDSRAVNRLLWAKTNKDAFFVRVGKGKASQTAKKDGRLTEDGTNIVDILEEFKARFTEPAGGGDDVPVLPPGAEGSGSECEVAAATDRDGVRV